MSNPANNAASMPRDAERRLVEQAQGGDQQALDELLLAHQDLVWRTALRLMAGNQDEAADLMQEVLISAFRNIGSFRGQSRFGTWLYRITSNLAKNRYVVQNRERARYSSLENPGPDPEEERREPQWADEGISPRTRAAGAELGELLQQRLAQLEPEWREMIVLRFFEDLSYEEIAATLQVPVGTVKSRISRARRMLRELMQDVMEK